MKAFNRAGPLRIPGSVWSLGLVSLFMDVSSEMIHSLLPVFLVTALGAGALTVGVIEGLAEATALIVKVFSGALSDFWGAAQTADGDGLRVERPFKAAFRVRLQRRTGVDRAACGSCREGDKRGATGCAAGGSRPG